MTMINRRTLSLELTITLRLAAHADLPLLEWHGQYKHFRNLFQRTFREQQQGRRLMLLADFNRFPIGHVFINFRQSRAYLYSFRVMEMFRGQGIGTSLLEEAECLITERGLRRAVIAVAKDNTAAHRLYTRLGYRVYGEDPGQWRYTDHRGQVRHVQEPCWLLEKNLDTG